AVRLALVEEARDRLLADVAALGEADRALVDPGLLRDHVVTELVAQARATRLDPEDLGGLLGRLRQFRALADHVDAAVGGDVEAERTLAVGVLAGRRRVVERVARFRSEDRPEPAREIGRAHV